MTSAARIALAEAFASSYVADVDSMDRWGITVTVIGLVIGLVGVLTHNDRAVVAGLVLAFGGIAAVVGL